MPPMQQFQQLNYAKQTVQSIQSVPLRRKKAGQTEKSKWCFTYIWSEAFQYLQRSFVFSSTRKSRFFSIELIVWFLADQNDSDSEASDEKEVIDLDSTVEKEQLDEQASEEEKDESEDDDEIIVLDVEKRSLCAKVSKEAGELKNEEETNQAVKQAKPSSEESKEKPIEASPVEVKPIEAKSNGAKSTNDEESKTSSSEEHQDRENAAADDSEDADRSDADASKSRESTSSRITLVSMGAPVPAALNGEKPPLENFGVGMGPMIHFENLPNSTGVFDKMRKVIKKIRKKLS